MVGGESPLHNRSRCYRAGSLLESLNLAKNRSHLHSRRGCHRNRDISQRNPCGEEMAVSPIKSRPQKALYLVPKLLVKMVLFLKGQARGDKEAEGSDPDRERLVLPNGPRPGTGPEPGTEPVAMVGSKPNIWLEPFFVGKNNND